MKRNCKKLTSLMIAIILLFALCTVSASAEENIVCDRDVDVIVQDFAKAYSDSLVQQSTNELQQIMEQNDDNAFFEAFMEWRFAIMQNMNSGYYSHNCDVVKIEVVSGSADVVNLHIYLNEDFEYKDGGTGYAYNVQMDMQVRDVFGEYKITKLVFTVEDFYGSFCEKMAAIPEMMSAESTEENLSNKLGILITELEMLRQEMDEVTQEQIGSEPEVEESISRAASYAYDAARGVQYARTYGSSPNGNFYTAAGRDCTNFVSQCVWAAYGGWNSTMSNTDMINNISNKVRMVPGVWQGGSGGGMPNWETVGRFWSYVTGNTGNGPKATGYNNGGWYTGVLPIDISAGDILQFRGDVSSYYHSVYVVSVPGGSNPSYDLIYVAQHSDSSSSRKLTELIGGGGNYMRQMRFHAGTFDK